MSKKRKNKRRKNDQTGTQASPTLKPPLCVFGLNPSNRIVEGEALGILS